MSRGYSYKSKLVQVFVKRSVQVQPALPVISQQAATHLKGSYYRKLLCVCCYLVRPSRCEQAAAARANKASVQSVQSWEVSEHRRFIRREEGFCAFSDRFYTGILFQRLGIVDKAGQNMLLGGLVSVALLFYTLAGEWRFSFFSPLSFLYLS